MGSLKITLTGTEGVKALQIGFLRFGDEVANLVPFLERVMEAMEKNADGLFQSEGRSGSAVWAPLAPMTQEIRAQTGFSGLPILENTGRLRNALGAQRGSGALRLVSKTGRNGAMLVYGTNGINYASFHQTGTEQQVTAKQQAFFRVAFGIHTKIGTTLTMPARPPIDFRRNGKMTPEFRAEVIRAARASLLEVQQKSGLSKLLGEKAAFKQLNDRLTR